MIEGSFDLALRNSAFEDSSLKGRKLANDTRVLCASSDYLEEYGVPEHPDELKTHQLIGFKDNAPRLLIGANGEPAEFNPRETGSRLMVDDGLIQKVATIAGVGVNGSTGERRYQGRMNPKKYRAVHNPEWSSDVKGGQSGHHAIWPHTPSATSGTGAGRG